MNILNTVYRILELLQQGRIIRYYVAWILRLVGVVTSLGALYLIIQLLKMSLSERMEATFTIAGLIACAILALAAVILLQICFYRAGKIIELGDSDFTVIPILSEYFRWVGEMLAAIVFVVGLVALIFFIFVGVSGYNPARDYLPMPGFLGRGSSPIIIFIAIPFITVSYSLACIIFFYFIAELVNVNVSMARNIAILVARPGNLIPANGVVADNAKAITETVVYCANCGTPNNPDDAYCANCGTKLIP